MRKAGLLSALGLAIVLSAAATPKAHAEVVVGVSVGTPVYVHPVRYGYVARPYWAPGAYVAYGPPPIYYRHVYVAPVYRERWYGPRYVVRREYCRRYYGYRR